MAEQLRSPSGERDGAPGQAEEPTAAEAVQEAGRQAGDEKRQQMPHKQCLCGAWLAAIKYVFGSD